VPILSALHVYDIADASTPDPYAVLAHARLLIDPITPHRLVIAWDLQGKAIGLAAVGRFISISDFRLKSSLQFELKELFVLPEMRGQSVGSKLLEWIEKKAKEQDICRLDWHVKQQNQRGIAFYERQGGRIVEGRISMRKLITG